MNPPTGPERDAYNVLVSNATAWFEGAAKRGICPICGQALTVRRVRDIMIKSAANKIGPDRPAYSCDGPGAPPEWSGLAEHHLATSEHFAFIGGAPK